MLSGSVYLLPKLSVYWLHLDIHVNAFGLICEFTLCVRVKLGASVI